MVKQKHIKLVWLPDTPTGLQSFQCWVEEHRSWIQSQLLILFQSGWNKTLEWSFPKWASTELCSLPIASLAPQHSLPCLKPHCFSSSLFSCLFRSQAYERRVVTWHRKISWGAELCCGFWSQGYCLYMQLESSEIWEGDSDCKMWTGEVVSFRKKLFLSGKLEDNKQNIN